MVKKEVLMSEKITVLAEKRTEMAFERTILAYIRTSATMILFGAGFLGFSKDKFDFFFNTSIVTITIGLLFLLIAVTSSIRHSKEMGRIRDFFGGMSRFRRSD